jgi:hypothetical protein
VVRPLAALLAALLLLAACTSEEPEPTPPADEPGAVDDEPEPDPDPGRAPLTGLPTDADLAERPLLVVKIENSPAARPQAGLDEADVVYEELVEGGVTRFITLFHSRIPEVAGPVRSARPVDVELISGFGEAPALAYSGARDEVMQMLRASPLVLITEGEAGFFRSSERRAPHNLYVRTADTLAGAVERGATPPSAEMSWRFTDEVPDGAETCPEDASDCIDPGGAIAVAMSTTFRTDFTYDEGAGLYRREQNGAPAEVIGDGRIGAANVVVLAMEHYVGGCCDTAGNPYAETRATGGGRAVILRDGRWYEARWSKADDRSPLRLLGGDDEPFPLKPGPTWVLLPSEDRVPTVPGL